MSMRVLLIVFAVFVLPLDAYARDIVKERVLDIQEIKSDGGIRAWLVEDHSVPVIAFDFSFKGAGAVNDPKEKQGLARMVSNTMDEGADDLDSQAFQKVLRDNVISLGFGSGRDHFSGSVKTLSKNKDLAFDLLKKALSKPRFDQEPFERMRESNKSRIRSSLSEPDWITARILNDIVYEGHPYALNSGGTLSSLDTITAEDLKTFAKSQFSRDRLRVAVAGDITAAELKALLDQVFGSLPEAASGAQSADDLVLQNAGEVVLYSKDIPQTMIELRHPGIKRTDPDYHLVQIMNFTLGGSGFGSRLTEEIREKRGLTYGIYSYLQMLDHTNAFAVSTSTANGNVKEMLELIRAELTRMKADGLTQAELEDAKAYMIGSLPLSLTSTDKISGLMLSLQMDDLPSDYLELREATIEDATLADIKRVASKVLNPDQLTTILVGQPEGVTPTKMIESLPNVE